MLQNKAPDCYFLRFSAGDELMYPLYERMCKGASFDREINKLKPFTWRFPGVTGRNYL